MDQFIFAGIVAITILVVTGPASGQTENHVVSTCTVQKTNVILIGATGDLARKYLWKGLFSLYRQNRGLGKQFKFIGATRLPNESGGKQMDDILGETVYCRDQDVDCQKAREEFLRLCSYSQLKTELDYQKLGESLEKTTEDNIVESNRIFYLSVPPFAYGDIVKRVNTHCRPTGGGLLKVVFEKPFGSDLDSANELAEELSKYLKEDEMYRIDHYLGKPGVNQILKFRLENKLKYEPLLNKDHVERVDIVLKEMADCKGRTQFYDKYGVIRDVIQNHMTELLTLIAMDLPSCSRNLTDIRLNKIKLLNSIVPPSARSAVIGQYKDYNTHYLEERADKQQDVLESTTQTFAAIVLFINSPRWHGVPFVVTSGKKLDERTAYMKVLFKNNIFHVNSTSSSDKCEIRQLIFNIQGGKLNRYAVLVSHNLPEPMVPINYWQQVGDIPNGMFGCQGDCFRAYGPLINNDAYSTLIEAVFSGRKDLFVGTDDLMASWKVWTPLLESLKLATPRLYDEDTSVLNFLLNNEELKFTITDDKTVGTCNAIDQSCEAPTQNKDFYRLPQFRGSHLFTGPEADVVYKLSIHIMEHASAAIAARGVFHLALSGGSTSLKLFRQLSKYSSSVVWENTHIWMVDERCVPVTDEMSNFHHLYKEFLQFLKIPFLNIHPMFIRLRKGLCDPEDHGAEHYDAQLRQLLNNNILDYVVLGVGTDGHTASLFPGHSTVSESKHLVKLSSCSGNCTVKHRMTMTLSLLNQAKAISVVILGEKKQHIVKKICSRQMNEPLLPIMKVKPVNGDLLWCVDDLALGNISSCNGS